MIIHELMKMSLFPEMMFTEASIQAFTVRGERKDPRILVLGLKASTPFLLLLLPTTTNASNGPPCTTRHGVQDQAGAGVCGEETSHDPQSLENKGRSCGPQFSAEVSPLSLHPALQVFFLLSSHRKLQPESVR